MAFKDKKRGHYLCAADIFEKEAGRLRRLMKKNGIRLTYFEFLTALAFLIFRREKVRAAVIETGLGGRLDATNVVYKRKLLNIITSISKEHTSFLGNTLVKILGEKEKIAARGELVVSLKRGGLKKHIKAYKKSVIFADEEYGYTGGEVLSDKMRVYNFSGKSGLITIKTRMIENVQAENIRSVLAGIDVLRKKGFKISPEAAVEGIGQTEIPGRLRYDKRGFFISVAHNPDAVDAALKTLRSLYGDRKIIYVFSGMADKDFDGIFRAMAKAGNIRVVLTKIDNPRAAEIPAMQRYLEKYGIKYYIEEDNSKALEKGLKIKGRGVMAAGGSFYLAGAYMRRGF
ncbi:MAG TPA: hypothetical protein ENN55_04930 [Firmicutes bacterium]|nr:hypothetical protein [Bacillota bacterium]